MLPWKIPPCMAVYDDGVGGGHSQYDEWLAVSKNHSDDVTNPRLDG